MFRTKSRLWIATLCAAALLSGCEKPTNGDFCDIAAPMYFDTDATVDWLAYNDPALLRALVAYNETAARCR